MVLQSNNPISFSNIMVEYGVTQKPFSFSNIYSLLGQQFGTRIGLSNMYGKTATPTYNLLTPVLNFDAETLSNLGVNTAISTWTNSGNLGSNYSMIGYGTTKPKVGFSNNQYHVSFDRTNYQYFNASNALPFTWFNNAGVYKGVTAFVLAKYTSTAGSFERFFDFGNGAGAGNSSFWLGRVGTGNILGTEIWNGTTNISGWVQNTVYNMNDARYHIYALNIANSASGCVVKLYVDTLSSNIASASFATSIANRTSTYNYLGRSEWADAYLNADIRQVLFYDSSLSDSDMSTVFNNLSLKWSLITPAISSISISKLSITSALLTWSGTYEAVNVSVGSQTVNSVTSNTYLVTGLTANTSYNVSITPTYYGISGSTTSSSFTTASSLQISSVSTSTFSTSVFFNINSAGCHYYIITWSGGSSGQQSASTYVAPGLTTNTAYTFTITPYSYENIAGTAQVINITTNSTWDPSSVTGVQNWYNATTLSALSSGSKVSTWWDVSGNSRNATQSSASAQPTFNPSGLNSKASVAFNNVAGVILNATAPNTTSFTIGIVSKKTIKSANLQNIFSLGGAWTSNKVHILNTISSRYETIAMTTASDLSTNFTFTDDTPFLYVVTFTIVGGVVNCSARANGTLYVSRSSGTNTGFDFSVINIGNWDGDTNRTLNGSISEIVVVNNLMSNTDIAKLEGYMAHTWWGAGSLNPLPSIHTYKNSPP